jgi:hypothetical protein
MPGVNMPMKCRIESARTLACRLLLPSVAAVLLAACARAPVAPEPVTWSLKDAKTVSVHFPDQPVRVQIGFNTKGYTIFGALYVGAAVAKMNAQTAEMQAALDAYLKAHPDIPSLQETFNRELEAQLRARGVEVANIPAKRKVDANKAMSYEVDPAKVSTNLAVVVDGLTASYFAPSATDQYNPRSRAGVTILDVAAAGKQLAQTQAVDDANLGNTAEYAYQDFATVKENLPQVYEGLQRSVTRLAKEVADVLLQDGKATSS